ncbi:MAG: electron transfer flavoprotein subunit alpha/FixB family protein, partial [Vicinamibacterales bacterium]
MILVVAEQRNGTLNRATWEALAAARELVRVQELDGQARSGAMPVKLPVSIAVLGSDVGQLARELAGSRVAEVLAVEHPALALYTPDAYAMALGGMIRSAGPTFVVFAHTYQTRDFAPLLAARMRMPIITDVTGITGTAAGVVFSRPMFQGKLVAQVRPIGGGTTIVTVQIGAFRADAVMPNARRAGAGSAEDGQPGDQSVVTSVVPAIDTSAIRHTAEAPFQEAKRTVDLGQAERIVSVGRGIKTQDKIPVAERLAKALGAELAASRPICDNGWLPMERQVGSSGQTVSPKLYVALGISGAI